jgi:cytochrome c2
MIMKFGIALMALAFATVPAMAQGDAVAGEAVFKRCASCHAVGPDARNKVGPELNGLIGRVAGTVPDYRYSDAMVEAGTGGLTWTAEELHAFLTAPKEKVPGTKMSFAGLKSQEDLDNVVAYLATFAADGSPAQPAP